MISDRTIEEINSQCERVLRLTTKVNKRSQAICLFHNDHDPSVDIDGKVWICRVCGAHGNAIQWHERVKSMTFQETVEELANILGIDVEYKEGEQKKALERARPKPMGNPTITYTYTDENGAPLYFIDRFDQVEDGKKTKTFSHRQPNGLRKAADTKVLYNLKELVCVDDRTVYIVEGEKCADAMKSRGLLATTWPGGAGAAARIFTPEYVKPLAGRNIVLLPDNDDAGRKAMDAVAAALKGIAKEILIIDLPVADKKHDVVDWFELGGTTEDLVRLADIYRKKGDWTDELEIVKGKITNTQKNHHLIFMHDEELCGGAIAMNELTGETYAKYKTSWLGHGEFPRALKPREDKLLASKISKKYGIEIDKRAALDALDAAAYEMAGTKPWNPLKEEIESVKWDGVPRIETWLNRYIGSLDSKYSRAVGKKWLIGAIARLYQPGCKMENVLILEGNQGAYKSTALEILAGGDRHFNRCMPEKLDKDARAGLKRFWIIEMQELEGVNGSTVNTAKAFFSDSRDYYRGAYAALFTDDKRHCVFAATTNDKYWNKDPTGARRFWPVEVGFCHGVDLKGLKRDRQQIWAEALVEYRAWYAMSEEEREGKALWWLTKEEEVLAKEMTDERREEDIIADKLVPFLREKAIKVGQTTLNEVMDYLQIRSEIREREKKQVTSSMRRCNWTSHRGGSGNNRPTYWIPTKEFLDNEEIAKRKTEEDDIWGSTTH